MANPDGEDTGKEWIEIYNASGAPRSLAGLDVSASRPDGTAAKTHVVTALEAAAADYVVIGSVLPELKPSHVDYGAGSDLGGLLNAGGRITLRCGGAEIDRAEYGEMKDGVARGLSGGGAVPDYQQNDDPLKWCDATTSFEPNGLGSPGGENEMCPAVGPQGMCVDGGTLRATDPPSAGDLVITEVMPDPAAVADTAGEWFEVVVLRDVDLNGLGIGKSLGALDTTIAPLGCVKLKAGDRLLFAHGVDAAQNGGLPAVDAVFTTGLTNSGGTLVLAVGATLVDQIGWGSAKAGKSIALDPDHESAGENDVATNFCDGQLVYGAGDKGTPRAVNEQCPLVVPAGMCDDGGVVRPIVSPTAGQIEITELLPDPTVVGDAVGEWIELGVSADVDLNGLAMGRTPPTVDGTITAVACLEATAGSRVVLARLKDPSQNGMVPNVLAPFPTGLSLTNGSSGLFVAIAGTVLDAMTYGAVSPGRSIIVDAINKVCVAPAGTPAYNGTDVGTPGAPNGADCP
jgi:hypothetical protein